MSVLTTNVPLVLMVVFGPGGGGGVTVTVTVWVGACAVEVTVTAAGSGSPHPVRTTATAARAAIFPRMGSILPRTGRESRRKVNRVPAASRAGVRRIRQPYGVFSPTLTA